MPEVHDNISTLQSKVTTMESQLNTLQDEVSHSVAQKASYPLLDSCVLVLENNARSANTPILGIPDSQM